MVCIREMRVGVGERRVAVPVGVALAGGRVGVMQVLVVGVMDVGVAVF